MAKKVIVEKFKKNVKRVKNKVKELEAKLIKKAKGVYTSFIRWSST